MSAAYDDTFVFNRKLKQLLLVNNYYLLFTYQIGRFQWLLYFFITRGRRSKSQLLIRMGMTTGEVKEKGCEAAGRVGRGWT